VTISKEHPATFAAGFTFVRRQRDPEFREYLKRIGWIPGQDVVMADDAEPVGAVLARIIGDQVSSPCLIAIEHPDEPFGFRILFAEIGRPRWHHLLRRRRTPLDISPDASIGMLYDSLHPCGEYVPNEWVKPITFERPSTTT